MLFFQEHCIAPMKSGTVTAMFIHNVISNIVIVKYIRWADSWVILLPTEKQMNFSSKEKQELVLVKNIMIQKH